MFNLAFKSMVTAATSQALDVTNHSDTLQVLPAAMKKVDFGTLTAQNQDLLTFKTIEHG